MKAPRGSPHVYPNSVGRTKPKNKAKGTVQVFVIASYGQARAQAYRNVCVGSVRLAFVFRLANVNAQKLTYLRRGPSLLYPPVPCVRMLVCRISIPCENKKALE